MLGYLDTRDFGYFTKLRYSAYILNPLGYYAWLGYLAAPIRSATQMGLELVLNAGMDGTQSNIDPKVKCR